MYHYEIELRAANPNCPFSFSEEEKTLIYNGVRVSNASANFKTYKKKITILELNTDYILVDFQSNAPLETPALSLRGFSRWLIETKRFDRYIYRHSLFKSTVRIREQEKGERELNDVEAVQEVVSIFFNNNKEDKEIKEELRKLITIHINSKT